MAEPVYHKRVLCFIDILGFKDHIQTSATTPDHALRILDALKLVSELAAIPGTDMLQRRAQTVSDSIIISYPAELQAVTFQVMLDVVHIMLELTHRGFFYRGAIVVDDLYHDDNIVFGPALTKAYELETKTACYPRVLLTKDVFDLAASNPYHDTADEELSYLFNLSAEDTDGWRYIDFLKQDDDLDEWVDFGEYLSRVRQHTKDQLALAIRRGNGPVQKKYHWFINYFNRVATSEGYGHLAI